MKLSLESHSDINEITSYDDNHVVIRSCNSLDLLRLEENFILTPTLVVPNKTISDVVEPNELDYLKALEPEVLILSKVAEQQLSPHVLVTLSQQAIGVESMLIGAACRTYNLLAAEGRHVVLVVKFD